MSGKCPFSIFSDPQSRRGFFKAAGSGIGLIASTTALGALPSVAAKVLKSSDPSPDKPQVVPFWDKHQAGIVTAQQSHTYFAAFDLTSERRDEIILMLKAWTEAAARMSVGQTAAPLGKDLKQPALDSGEASSLPPSRLTLTFGFGPGLFIKGGVDRYGLSELKPEAMVDMPKFHGDELIETKTGGDLSVQASADDPQVAFHAVRQLVRLASNVAQLRWAQTGFLSGSQGSETPRNLMGFKDGTQQPKEKDRNKFVWVGQEGPEWLRGGSYLVVRRIRIALEHWDGTDVDFQEQVIGRHKHSGAPLGRKNELEPLHLDALDKDGNPIMPENAHVRLAASASNGGSQIHRRGYSYNDGVNFTAERWPPWRQGMEYDAGLFFVAYQSDPRSGFIRIFENMAKTDALNQFATHVGSGLYACPPGLKKGEYIGQKLFETQRKAFDPA